jgi:hypothetical protein
VWQPQFVQHAGEAEPMQQAEDEDQRDAGRPEPGAPATSTVLWAKRILAVMKADLKVGLYRRYLPSLTHWRGC